MGDVGDQRLATAEDRITEFIAEQTADGQRGPNLRRRSSASRLLISRVSSENNGRGADWVWLPGCYGCVTKLDPLRRFLMVDEC